MIEKVKNLEQKVSAMLEGLEGLKGERRELKERISFLTRQLDQVKEQLEERESSVEPATAVLPVEAADALRRAVNELRGH